MVEVEFQAKVENGSIVIPDEHKSALAKVEQVKVIFRQPTKPFFEDDFIAQLLQNPMPITDNWKMSRDEMHDRA